MIFQAYQRRRRLSGALQDIRAGHSVIDAGLASGFESASAFRDAFTRLFGTTPGRSRQAALVVQVADSPVGPLVIAAAAHAVCMLEFGDPAQVGQRLTRLGQRFGMQVVPGGNTHTRRLEQQLQAYFAGRRQEFDVPLALRGTPFEERVWMALQAIPYGQTRSYADLAAHIGQPTACRAVGLANGRNPLAIIIPCHRVINKSGALGGYGGGLWRKRFLLDLEQRHWPVRLQEVRRAQAPT